MVQVSRLRPIAIFDFDGTIADSLELAIDQYNQVAPRFRVKPIERGSLRRLRTLTPREAMKEHNISFWKLPLLVRAMRKAMHDHVDRVQAIAGVVPALHSLSEAGCRCSILSTNSTANIARFLARHELSMFEHVAGGSSMFGKAAALKRLMRRTGLDARSVFYVGDEVRDVAAAAAAGVRSIAVSWGYADRNALLAEKPDHLVDHPTELVELLRSCGLG